MSTLWIQNQLNLSIELESYESAFDDIDPVKIFERPVFKRQLFPAEDVAVIGTEYQEMERYRGVKGDEEEDEEEDEEGGEEGKDCLVRYNVIYRQKKRLEFVNPNAHDTNKTRIDKFPPTKRSEVDYYKRRFIETFNGGPFWYKKNGWKFYVSVRVNNHQVILSPELEARFYYSNEEIAEANVLAQRQQERQEAIKVVAKSPLAGTGVSGIVESFLGGRRYTRQSRRKQARKSRKNRKKNSQN